ncbi:MAG: hypothetical protein M0P16_00665 [Syntrophales bacterium]|jgi:hypothetical protein|nr:hypothetical protein [Syntrophales bacterium]MCK9390299.1 hypothetical protein [Syntrophales bacterium]
MAKQYKEFSKQEHLETSTAINAICKQLIDLSEKIIPAYGVSSTVGKEIQKLVLSPNIMSDLKLKLENAYLCEHGGKANESPYYDGRGYA